MNTKHFNAAVEFGEQLLKTNDLDPVYVAIHGACLKWDQRARLVLAYSCLYHLGAAAYLSEFREHEFWVHLLEAAYNHKAPTADGRWPRGTERRHWRAENAIKSVKYLRNKTFGRGRTTYECTPEDIVEFWMSMLSFEEFSSAVQEVPSFGPWITFKLFDLSDRVLEGDIPLDGCELALYEEPKKGAELIIYGIKMGGIEKLDVDQAIILLNRKLGKFKAPPDYKRRIGILEYETILCKYKSFVNGHYHVGKDISEIRHGLAGPWGATAQRLLKALPPEVTP